MRFEVFKRGKRYYNHAKERLFYIFKSLFLSGVISGYEKLKRRRGFLENINSEGLLHDYQDRSLSSDEVRLTWLGHATFLIQAGSVNILTDPIFFDIQEVPLLNSIERQVPLPFLWHSLPPIDFVLISHNHTDHLDEESVKLLLERDSPFIASPKGCKEFIESWGAPHAEEFSWGEIALRKKGGVEVEFTFLPARHWSGRSLFDINKSLWGSWMVRLSCSVSKKMKTIYFGGDTAYGKHYQEIAAAFPHIDVALLPIAPGAPRCAMKDTHMDAQDSLKAFKDLKSKTLIPMHWGTFQSLSNHFSDDIVRLKDSWKAAEDKELIIPELGKSIEI